jgi:hypothetical protein
MAARLERHLAKRRGYVAIGITGAAEDGRVFRGEVVGISLRVAGAFNAVTAFRGCLPGGGAACRRWLAFEAGGHRRLALNRGNLPLIVAG